jgi:hypothetical protein
MVIYYIVCFYQWWVVNNERIRKLAAALDDAEFTADVVCQPFPQHSLRMAIICLQQVQHILHYLPYCAARPKLAATVMVLILTPMDYRLQRLRVVMRLLCGTKVSVASATLRAVRAEKAYVAVASAAAKAYVVVARASAAAVRANHPPQVGINAGVTNMAGFH